MSEKDLDQAYSASTPLKPSASDTRKARLDTALRANLRRRKDQVRSRGLDGEIGDRDTPSIFKTDDGRTRSK